MNVNKVILIGSLSKPPQIREKGATLNILTLEENQGKSYRTYHMVQVWGKAREECTSLVEGDLVYVEGKINNRSYEKDGKKTWITEVSASVVTKLNISKSPEVQQKSLEVQEVEADDIPF